MRPSDHTSEAGVQSCVKCCARTHSSQPLCASLSLVCLGGGALTDVFRGILRSCGSCALFEHFRSSEAHSAGAARALLRAPQLRQPPALAEVRDEEALAGARGGVEGVPRVKKHILRLHNQHHTGISSACFRLRPGERLW
eukprot:3527802-Rhodomonas_salina.1